MKKKSTQPCPDCQGAGIRVWATDKVTCATCSGKGTVAVRKPNPKDRG